MDPNDPIVLHSSTPAEFLSTLPTLAGFQPTNCMLAVPFTGSRTSSVLRVDLPAPDVSPEAAATAIDAVLARVPLCRKAAIVVYADESFPVAFLHWTELAHALARRLVERGVVPIDALCVAADGWASWLEDDTPVNGHALADIHDSRTATAAAAARHGRPLPADGARRSLPAADVRTARAVAARLRADARQDADAREGAGVPPPGAECGSGEGAGRGAGEGAERGAGEGAGRGARTIEALTAETVGAPTVAQIALLCRLAGDAAVADAALVRIAFGHVGVPEDGEAATLRVLMGDTCTAPRVRRLRRALEVVRYALVHVPAAEATGLCCMAVWMHWALGEGSAAHHLLERLRATADDDRPQVLAALLDGGRLPEWVFAAHGMT